MQGTRRLYEMLARRHKRSQLFLHRGVRDPHGKQVFTPPEQRPSVRYACGHRSIAWATDFPRLRCLWCTGRTATSVGFPDADALLLHLKACHGRFRYVCNGNVDAADLITIELKLLTGEAGLAAVRVDKFDAWDMEAVYVNTRRYPHYNGPPGLSPWKTSRFVTKPIVANGTEQQQQIPVKRAAQATMNANRAQMLSDRARLGRSTSSRRRGLTRISIAVAHSLLMSLMTTSPLSARYHQGPQSLLRA
jgi:hypothetical protein